MSARGTKRRGRPPKSVVMERPRKFQYHLLKKPKYLLNQSNDFKGSETPNSQASTPTASRASSPVGSESSRRSFRSRGRSKFARGSSRGRPAHRRGYNPELVNYKDSEYHYGSDFDEESSGKSEHEDDLLSDSLSDTHKDDLSDSDFSLSSFSTASGATRKSYSYVRNPSPVPIWLQEVEIPKLELPPSSDDLLIPKEHIMQALSIYEVLRHFRNLVRITPFRFEDFCAVMMFEDQTYLLAEIHIMLLKAILREEDSQQTHFGPQDQKDSVNVSLFFIDAMTWPEVLRSYIESDKNFDHSVLDILNNYEYPFVDVDLRLKVLQFLTDQFLITNPVREDLIHEGNYAYEDHCRVCHRVGDLVCCETCPAVYHLECVEPPLNEVPREDWQCNICRLHKVSGVTDCIPDVEKSGHLCRQEHLGFDRHGRKYFFLTRRIFVESEEGESWYYSCEAQLDELMESLDSKHYEAALCREMTDFRAEIIRQMNITERLTTQVKGNRKAYLDVQTATILKRKQDKEEREKMIAEGKIADFSTDTDSGLHMGNEVANEEIVDSSDMNTLGNSDSSEGKESDQEEEDSEIDKIEKDGVKKGNVVTRSKTGSLGPRGFNVDEVKKKGDKLNDIGDNSRLTRLKAHQIASGTHLFKLGMENGFKTYNNHFNTNPSALSRIQKNEERDKKRFLSHKFSLTQASEFKWAGPIHGSKPQLLSTVRQTMLQLENAIPSSLMHVNWGQVRKAWVSAVATCNNARDFGKAIVVLQACIKTPVYASVWNEQLGHIKMIRTTAADREERKKIEKREKKDKEEEEERNRFANNFVKYTLGLKHQVYKQKGEEYRVHGQWGWQWLSATRIYKLLDCRTVGLRAGPQKFMVQVRDERGFKIIAVDPSVYKALMEKDKHKEDGNKLPDLGGLNLNNVSVYPPITKFEEINISKALVTPGRLHYPKVAKKSKLDEFLSRRTHLKNMEEKQLAQMAGGSIAKPAAVVDREVRNLLAAIGRRVSVIKTQYANLNKQSRMYRCYGVDCDATTVGNCYSPVCMQRAALRKELLILLRRANTARHSSGQVQSPSNPNNIKPEEVDVKKEPVDGVVPSSDEVKFSPGTETLRAVLEGRVLNEKKLLSSPIKQEPLQQSPSTPVAVKKEKLDGEGTEGNEVDMSSLDPVNEVVIKTEEIKQETVPRIDEVSLDDSKKEEKPLIKEEPKVEEEEMEVCHEVEIGTTEESPVPGPSLASSDTPTPAKADDSVQNSPVSNVIKKDCPTKAWSPSILLPKPDPKRMYSSPTTVGKVYLKKVSSGCVDKRKRRVPIKYPRGSTFQTRAGKKKSILILPQHELSKMARLSGRIHSNGFNHLSKPNPQCWPYPCSRPNFRVCWLYRTINFKTLAAAGLQLRILWACLRWDDMQAKAPNPDGKNQITTETEIITTELLKHRNVGVFLERTEYLQRKVVIPIDLPKTIRGRFNEVQSTRTGLRKRKREDNPQNTEPQVKEEWIDETKLELWEVKAYGERLERQNAGRTRSSTGALARQQEAKASMEEMKEKLEAQLRAQRVAHNQRRANHPDGNTPTSTPSSTSTKPHVIKIVPSPSGGTEQFKVITKLPIPASTTTTPGKSALTSLLTSSPGTPTAGVKQSLGTRRIIMTKGRDGTARVVSGATGNLISKTQSPQTIQQVIKIQHTPQATSPAQQRVQITKGPDGKLQVKGLLPGQQLVQLADGRLHVLNPSNIVSSPAAGQAQVQAKQTAFVQPAASNTVVKATPGKPQQVVMKPVAGTSAVQKSGTNATVVVSNAQVNAAGQLVVTTAPNTQVAGGQLVTGSQIVVNNQTLLYPSGKATLATLNGQQVLIRSGLPSTVTNQAGQTVQVQAPQLSVIQQAKGSLKPQTIKTASLPSPTASSSAKPVVSSTSGEVDDSKPSLAGSPQSSSISSTTPANKSSSQISPEQEKSLLAGQPPGTVIKVITAQVIQTQHGPRIVLQGLTGSNFSPSQLAIIQQQVKQQLLKAQAEAGNQGVLGPTKIYLAVHPTSATSPETAQPKTADPPDLAPSSTTASPVKSIVNGGQGEVVSSPAAAATPPPTTPAATPAKPDKFVLTPDYIQQTIKSALRQENLSPEMEQKLIKLQRYQAEQRTNPVMKEEVTQPAQHVAIEKEDEREEALAAASQLASLAQQPPRLSTPSTPVPNTVSRKKRPQDDPAHSPPPKRKTTKPPAKEGSPSKNNRSKGQEEKKKHQQQSKLLALLFRHKETLKREILRKRSILEKELQVSIQNEVAVELAQRTKVERAKQDEGRVVGSSKRKSAAVAATPLTGRTPAGKGRKSHAAPPPAPTPSPPPVPPNYRQFKQRLQLLCICRTPYDDTKSYVGCDMCNNWFHGDCVGITEEMSKTLTEFICAECQHARESKELYCLCRQPYDDSQFYICCDRCQDWFHGKCVGILQREADEIEEYICPNCSRNSDINIANMRTLATRDFEVLKKLIKQIQAHKSAWPFMQPVDPTEAPDYYKVIKEPMDLQTVEMRINNRHYKQLRDFIGDMGKIIANCQYYNARESPFYKCADSLESFFLSKIKGIRDKISNP